MKIVRIIARLNVGGPARHVTWLTRELQDDEFDSILVAGTVPEGEQDMGYFAQEHGVEPVFIKEMSRELSPRDAVSFVKVLRLLFRENPDIVHTHTAKAGTVGRVAALAYKILSRRKPVVVHTYHGHVFHSYYGPALTSVFLAIERLLARIATDRIVVISEQQRREISETFGVGRPEQFRVIELGIDLPASEISDSERDEARSELGIGSDEFAVGFVGRLTEVKNLPMLIRAAETLKGTGRLQRIRFVIVGDGHLMDRLVSEIHEKDLEEHFLFLGHRADIAELYPAFDAVALTSLNEGTPLSLIEAMAAGVPVIATSVGGVVDLVGPRTAHRDGITLHERGLTVASDDAECFAEAVLLLSDDADLRASLGTSGREFVGAKYGKDRLVSDVKSLYRELIGLDS